MTWQEFGAISFDLGLMLCMCAWWTFENVAIDCVVVHVTSDVV